MIQAEGNTEPCSTRLWGHRLPSGEVLPCRTRNTEKSQTLSCSQPLGRRLGPPDPYPPLYAEVCDVCSGGIGCSGFVRRWARLQRPACSDCTRRDQPKTFLDDLSNSGGTVRLCGGLPTQAFLWLEWGSSTAGHNFPAARSRFRTVHSDSISTRPSPLVA